MRKKDHEPPVCAKCYGPMKMVGSRYTNLELDEVAYTYHCDEHGYYEYIPTPTTPTTPHGKHCQFCHPAPQHTSPEDKMKKGAKLFARDFTQTMQELAGTSPEKENTSHAIGFREGHVLGKKQERNRILALLESKKQEKHINQISPDGMLARKINQLLTSLREEILK